MKHNIILIILAGCLSLITSKGQAQSWKDLFNKDNVEKVVNAVTGNSSALTLEGTWNYEGTACKFKSDDLLKKAGGAAAATLLENKMDEYCAKVGIIPGKFSYTFNADSTFINTYGSRKLQGTYSIDPQTKIITLTYMKIIPFRATASQTSNKLTLLFDADKLLKLLTTISLKSNNQTLKGIGNLTNGYDGAQLGFELSK